MKQKIGREKESWIDILLGAAREAGFAHKMSAHQLDVFSMAIRFELGNRRMSTFEAEEYAGEMQRAIEVYLRSGTATDLQLMLATKEKLILALRGPAPEEA